MKKVCVVTATRAEYGLLRNVIDKINKDDELELCLTVTGTHLSEQFGNTVQEIIEDGFPISERIPILDKDNSESGVVEAISRVTKGFGNFFEKHRPDMLVVLGDRYEILPICQCASIYKIPIAHISGGEITTGAADDMYRHAITKLSHIHFASCETYRKRIIQMGEQPSSVFNYGDVGVENIKNMKFIDRDSLFKDLGLKEDMPVASVTFHPVTTENKTAAVQIEELLAALDEFKDMQFVITKANADVGGEDINKAIDLYVARTENAHAFFSLGINRYLSLMKYSKMVIGNSSSGIIEAPCFKIPTVNIGDRQKGRLRAESIIDCMPVKQDIVNAIQKALSPQFRECARHAVNPFGEGNTSEMIVKEIKDFLKNNSGIQKIFYDL